LLCPVEQALLIELRVVNVPRLLHVPLEILMGAACLALERMAGIVRDLAADIDERTELATLMVMYAFVNYGHCGRHQTLSRQVYDNAQLGQIIRGLARPVVSNTARLCIREEQEEGAILPGSIFMKIRFLSSHPVETEPWKSLFEENSPGRSMIPAPIFIGQGEEDGLVHPDVTEAFAESLCAKGHVVEYRSYPDVHHVTAVAVVTPDAVAWIVDRFAGALAPSTCS
jgi:acetyl esterase/lipase